MNTQLVNEVFQKLKTCMPKRDSFKQKFASVLYKELVKGQPVPEGKISDAMNTSKKEMNEKINDLPGIYRNDTGEFIGFWGLAVGYKSPHKLIVNGKSTNTWCAWDALFVPGIIGETAKVELTCPETGYVTKLKVSDIGISEVTNEEAVISFVLPEVFDENIIKNFCHFIYGFKNQETFEKWQSEGNENCFSFSLAEAYELGQLKNKYQFHEVLGDH